MIELNEDTRNILGKPNFWCAPIARQLRDLLGHDIAFKAEAEQAAVIHWLLTHYEKAGENWADSAAEEMRAAKKNQEES